MQFTNLLVKFILRGSRGYAAVSQTVDIVLREIMWVIKLFEGLPKFMRVSREGLTLLECQFFRVWFEGLV